MRLLLPLCLLRLAAVVLRASKRVDGLRCEIDDCKIMSRRLSQDRVGLFLMFISLFIASCSLRQNTSKYRNHTLALLIRSACTFDTFSLIKLRSDQVGVRILHFPLTITINLVATLVSKGLLP